MKLRTKKILTVVIATLVLIYSAIWLFSPNIAPHFINKQLTPLGLSLSEKSHLRYNPFISTLTLNNIEILQQERNVLKVKELTFSFHLIPLLFNELKISSLAIEGLYLTIEVEDELTKIMGIPLPDTEKNSETVQEEPANFGIVADKIALHDTEIDLKINSKPLLLDTSLLEINSLQIDENSQTLDLLLKSSLAESAIVLDANLAFEKNIGTIDSNIKIKNGSFNLIKAYYELNDDQFNALVNFSGQQKVTVTPEKIAIDIIDNKLSIENFLLTDAKVSTQIAKQSLAIPSLEAQFLLGNHDKPLSISGEGNFEINSISVNSLANDGKLIDINQIIAPQFVINANAELPQLLFSSIAINDAVIAKTEQSPALIAFSSFEADTINITEDKMNIARMALNGTASHIFINKQGELISTTPLSVLLEESETANTVPESANTTKDNTKEESSPSSLPYHIKLDQFSLTGNNTIEFTDKSVSPTYKRDITIETFTLAGLDSENSESTASLALKGKSNEYANFDLNVQIQHFAKIPQYGVAGVINEVSLPAVSSYLKDTISYEIDSGQLNLTLDATLSGDDIDGDVDVFLHGFNFSSIEQADEHQDANIISFAVALDMLKDSDGNVDLNIPLSGDINEPAFGAGGFMTLVVKKATMMAAKDYLVKAFVPYGNVLTLVETASKHLLKIRFNDLPYQVEQRSTDSSQQVYIDDLATLLQNKEHVDITLCAIATPQDIKLPKDIKKAQVSQDDIEALHQISSDRMKIFKKLLVENYQIASSRLLLCSPKIDYQAKATPRMKFTRNNN